MSDTLAVKIADTRQYLLETTLDFAGGHSAFLDCGVKITTGTVFHDFTPVLVLVLDQVDSLNNIDMV